MISRDIASKFISKSKEDYYFDLGRFDYNIYKLTTILKKHLSNASITGDNFFKPATIKEAERYTKAINMAEDYIMDNIKDVFNIKED